MFQYRVDLSMMQLLEMLQFLMTFATIIMVVKNVYQQFINFNNQCICS